MAVLLLGTLAAAVIQQGNLRITVLSQILPNKLPRQGTAPIAVFISGHVGAVDGTVPPQLQRMAVRSTATAVSTAPACRPARTGADYDPLGSGTAKLILDTGFL